MTTEISDRNRKTTRSFKVKLTKEGELYGRYNGDSPYQAANKALSEIIRKKLKENTNISDLNIHFYLVESTKGSQKKEYEYNGTRIKLDIPIKYIINDNKQEIIKNYKNILRKVKQNFK